MNKDTYLKQIEGTPYQRDLSRQLNSDGENIPLAVYNLLLSIRDLKLFCKGISPHRNWSLAKVKSYFGVRGGKDKVLSQLKAYEGFLSL